MQCVNLSSELLLALLCVNESLIRFQTTFEIAFTGFLSNRGLTSNLVFWFTNVCMGRRRRIWPRCWSTGRTILHSIDCETQHIVDRENSSFLVRGWTRLDHEALPRLGHPFGTACQPKSPTRRSTLQLSRTDSKHSYSNSLSWTNRDITPAARAPLWWPCYKETLYIYK